MTDDKAPAPQDDQPTTPLPASAESAAASETAPAPAAATTAPAKSPWPVLIPVLVGVGALLLGGVFGGAAGFAIGTRLDRGPAIEYRMPDLPGNNDRRGPEVAPGTPGMPDGQFQRGGVVSGTITELADGSVTVELENGETVTLTVSDDTPVVEVDSSSLDDLATGEEITVVVSRDGDGNREARLIRTGDADLLSLGGALRR